MCLYYRHGRATYTMSPVNRETVSGVDFNEVVWYRTVDMKTGLVLDTNAKFDCDYQDVWLLIEALNERFSPEYIVADAFGEIGNQLNEESLLHEHIVFGRAIFYADVHEIVVHDENGEQHVL